MKKTAKIQDKTEIVRPPIIAVMGHIDHGKSTLLDYILKTNVVAKEAGGITQRVGAYEVIHTDKNGKVSKITFIDTPGHSAFSGIRERGATLADIAILVVSAEEGVKPQTLEALKYILEAKTPYVVAMTKIDKEGANVERTKISLAENEVYLEGYGGTIPNVAVSSKTGQGIEDLLDTILLMAEIEELKGNPNIPAEGRIVEAHLDPKKGMTATLIIENGTLNKGEFLTSENSCTPVRAIENFIGKNIESATFSSPVLVRGWNNMPKVGAKFTTCSSKKEAETKSLEKFVIKTKAKSDDSDKRIKFDIVLKADVAGSLEALEKEILKLNSEKLKVDIVSKGVGNISESDVKSASALKNPILFGFNVSSDVQAVASAERLNIPIEIFDIIYKLVERLEAEVKLRTPKTELDEVVGKAKILKVFSKEKDKQIIGGRVEIGALTSGSVFKIMRRENEIGRGKIRGLEQQKVKASEVNKGSEFGAMIEAKIEIVAGDFLETFTTTLV